MYRSQPNIRSGSESPQRTHYLIIVCVTDWYNKSQILRLYQFESDRYCHEKLSNNHNYHMLFVVLRMLMIKIVIIGQGDPTSGTPFEAPLTSDDTEHCRHEIVTHFTFHMFLNSAAKILCCPAAGSTCYW